MRSPFAIAAASSSESRSRSRRRCASRTAPVSRRRCGMLRPHCESRNGSPIASRVIIEKVAPTGSAGRRSRGLTCDWQVGYAADRDLQRLPASAAASGHQRLEVVFWRVGVGEGQQLMARGRDLPPRRRRPCRDCVRAAPRTGQRCRRGRSSWRDRPCRRCCRRRPRSARPRRRGARQRCRDRSERRRQASRTPRTPGSREKAPCSPRFTPRVGDALSALPAPRRTAPVPKRAVIVSRARFSLPDRGAKIDICSPMDAIRGRIPQPRRRSVAPVSAGRRASSARAVRAMVAPSSVGSGSDSWRLYWRYFARHREALGGLDPEPDHRARDLVLAQTSRGLRVLPDRVGQHAHVVARPRRRCSPCRTTSASRLDSTRRFRRARAPQALESAAGVQPPPTRTARRASSGHVETRERADRREPGAQQRRLGHRTDTPQASDRQRREKRAHLVRRTSTRPSGLPASLAILAIILTGSMLTEIAEPGPRSTPPETPRDLGDGRRAERAQAVRDVDERPSSDSGSNVGRKRPKIPRCV